MRIGQPAVCLVIAAVVFVCVAHGAPQGQQAQPAAALSETFDGSGAAGWELVDGAQVASVDGQTALTCSNGGHGYWVAAHARDLDLKFRYRAGEGVGRVAVNISGEPPNNQEYSIVLPPGEIGIDRFSGGQMQTLAGGPSPIEPGGWYDVAVRVQNGQISVSVGGQPVVTAVDRQPLSAGIVGFGAAEGSGFAFDNVTLSPAGAVVETHAMQVEVQDPMVAQVTSGTSGQTTGSQTMHEVTPIPAQQFPATTKAEPVPIQGNFDIYMKLGDIPGDATTYRRPGWTRVDAYGFSIGSSTSNDSWTHRDHGRGSSTTAFGPLMVTKPIDVGSPEIYIACAKASVFSEATLVLVDQNGRERFTVKLKEVRILGVETKVSPGTGPGDGLVETIGLSFSEMEWTYADQKLGNISKSWDLVGNKQK